MGIHYEVKDDYFSKGAKALTKIVEKNIYQFLFAFKETEQNSRTQGYSL